jgi:TRAP-type mannitol/chloroaromatic compound transport system permease small subunit
MIDIITVVMAMHEILSMSWKVLEFAMEAGPLICLVIFLMVMVKTMLDLSKKLVKMAAPGIRKMNPSSRKK